jgi:iron-sulfur cluster assembly protein
MIPISPKAIEVLRQALADEEDPELFVRIRAEGNGCSGFSCTLALDDLPRRNDRRFEPDGVPVRIDEASAILLKGSLVEFDPASGFQVVTVHGPMGCGSSCGAAKKKKPS